MANYTANANPTLQYKLDQLMQMPEFKAFPSTALALFMKNTEFLVPSKYVEKVMNTKNSDSDTVNINIINKQSSNSASVRATAHTGNINDGSAVTATFTTYAEKFKYSLKGSGRNIWDLNEQVAKQFLSAFINLHETIDAALVTSLNTNRSQVVESLTPASGIWDPANFILKIANADEKRVPQRAKGFMREQKYSGTYDMLADEGLFQLMEFYMQQGTGNETNLGWQGTNLNVSISESITAISGYTGIAHIIPVGTYGILPWIPEENRLGSGQAGENGGKFYSMLDPLGSGLLFAIHEYNTGADNQSAAGERQDVDTQVEISVDLSPIYAPESTANMNPGYKVGLLNS